MIAPPRDTRVLVFDQDKGKNRAWWDAARDSAECAIFGLKFAKAREGATSAAGAERSGGATPCRISDSLNTRLPLGETWPLARYF